MNILLLLICFSMCSAELCIRLLRNFEETRTIRKIPSRVWRWNNTTQRFEQLEALRLNNTALCSVDSINDIRGKTLAVAADFMNPYIIIKENNTGVTGFIGDAWTILEDILKFRTIYRRAGPSTRQTLMNGQTHALLAATAIYSYTSGYYTYSTTITTNSYALFVQSEGLRVSAWWYARIFSHGLWAMAFTFIVSITVTVMLIYRIKRLIFSNYEEYHNELASASFNLLFVLRGISGQGFPKLPKSWSLRIIVLVQLMMGMLLSGGFSSTLTSSLAIRGMSVPLSSLEDVVQKRTHSLCVRNDSSAYIHFTEDGSPEGELKEEWKDLVNKGCPDMRDSSKLSPKLCKPGFAYLEAPDVFLPIYRQVRNECRIVRAHDDYWSLRLAFLHARSSQYKNVIDNYLMRLRSSGILRYLERKWINSEQGLTEDSSNYEWSHFQPVEYAHIHIAVCALTLVAIFSIFICVLEHIWYRLQSEYKVTDYNPKIKNKCKLKFWRLQNSRRIHPRISRDRNSLLLTRETVKMIFEHSISNDTIIRVKRV